MLGHRWLTFALCVTTVFNLEAVLAFLFQFLTVDLLQDVLQVVRLLLNIAGIFCITQLGG